MTNKEFEQQCYRNFKRLTNESRLNILARYVREELKTHGTQFENYFERAIEKKGAQNKDKAEQKFKFLVWYHNNYVVPNWRNTHFEITTYIISFRLVESSGVVKEIYEDGNHAPTPRLWELAEKWTNEFEKKYIGHDWGKDDDYYEKIIEFCDGENKKVHTYV